MRDLLLKLEDFRLLPVFVAVSMAVGIAIGNILSISDFELTQPIDALKSMAGGTFDASVPALISLGVERDAYAVFLQSIPYRFYPIFALALVFFIAWRGRDFGTMLKAERRARSGGGVIRPGAAPLMKETDEVADASGRAHAGNALLPILIVVVVTLGGILLTGWGEVAPGQRSLMNLFGSGDSTRALLWAAAAAFVVREMTKTGVVLPVGLLEDGYQPFVAVVSPIQGHELTGRLSTVALANSKEDHAINHALGCETNLILDQHGV